MKNLKALIEKRNATLEKMKAIVAKADKETRAFTEDENKSYADLKAEFESLDATIKTMEEQRNLEPKKNAEPTPKSEKETREQAENRAFENFVRGIVETRAEGDTPTTGTTEDTGFNMTFADNGAVIPTSIANKIIDKVKEISPIYALATKYNVGGTLTIPYYDTADGDITMAYAEEFTELTSTGGKFKSISLKGFLAGVLTLVSKSLLNNSNFDIVGFIVNKMAENIAGFIEKECIDGTTGKITGLSGLTASVTAASQTVVTADELIDLQEAIPDLYQSGAVWIMSKAMRTAIRKLKDSDGNYLLNRDVSAKWGYTLLGKDVYISDNMPAPAKGTRAIVYGDLSGLAIKISENASIDILRERYTTQHAIGVYAYIEMDAKVENAQKLAVLEMKKS